MKCELGTEDAIDGGSTRGEIMAGALADLRQVTNLGPAGDDRGQACGSEIKWEEPADECVDVFDAVSHWWTPAEATEGPERITARILSFLSTLRYHNPVRSAIIVSHSLFIQEFCNTYADPASGSLLDRLCKEKLANASVVALDISFGVGACAVY